MGWWVERFGITSSTAATTRRLVLRVKSHTARILTPPFWLYVSQLMGVNTLVLSARVPLRHLRLVDKQIKVERAGTMLL